MIKITIALLFLIAGVISAWRIRRAQGNAARFLDDARRAGYDVLPAEGDEQPLRMGRVRLAATVRVMEYRASNGQQLKEMHQMWTLALRGDAAARGSLEVQKGGGSYGGMMVPLNSRLSASVKDAAALDVLDNRAKTALAQLDRLAPLIAFNAVGPELSASFSRTHTNLATAKKLAEGFENAARALGR